MVKALAFLVVFTLASTSAGQNPYDGAKDFILGYFTGFQESTYNLTNTCLPADFQTQMLADWDSIFSTDNIEKVFENAIKFEADLERMNEDCLLWVLPVSLIQSLETKGLDTVRDFIEHFGDIALDMIFFMENVDKDPFEAGRYFGTALGYFLVKVPVGPQRLRAAPVALKPNFLDGFTNFTKGLIHGLQLNNTGTSNCLNSFSTIASNVDNVGTVAFHCLLMDMDACNQLGVALENVLMVFVSFSTNCNFQKLFDDMGSLLTIDGWITLYKNMYWYQTQIRQAYSDLLTAYQAGDYYNEGINLGDIIQLAFSFTVK